MDAHHARIHTITLKQILFKNVIRNALRNHGLILLQKHALLVSQTVTLAPIVLIAMNALMDTFY